MKKIFLMAAGMLALSGLFPLQYMTAAVREPEDTEKQTMNADTVIKFPMSADGIIRLSKIEIYPQYVEEYMEYAAEVGEISLRIEPGVITMYALADKENPCHITILETYSSREAYADHIKSTHFQKYKQGTFHMVKSLVLADQMPLNPASHLINEIR